MPAVTGGKRTSTRAGKKSRAEYRDRCAADNLPCWICGMEIDYDAPHDDYRNDERFQVDHFFPVSTHPELQDDPDNYRPSNAGCNRARSDGSPILDLGVPSRAWT